MAHTCPTCGLRCHCSGDIDDINFGPLYGCGHCEEDEGEENEDFWDDFDDDDHPLNPK